MSKKNYSGSIALSKLKSAITTTKKGARCLVIPINENHLLEKDGAIYLPIRVLVHEVKDQYNNDGLIAQSLSSEEYKAIGKDEAQKINLPILGNIKDFTPANNDNSGLAPVPVNDMINEDDDLPF